MISKYNNNAVIVGRRGFYQAWETWAGNKRARGTQMDTLTLAKVGVPGYYKKCLP